jgi:protein SCO1/2
VNPRLQLALVLLGVFLVTTVVLVGPTDDDEPASRATAFEGARMPEGVRAPGFFLRNQDGERVSMRALRGGPVIVTFLYSTCEDTCPLQAQTIKGALNDLGEDVPALAIAVDPPRDTPESARRFLAEQRMTGRLDFVLGSRAELRPLWRGYAIRPQSVTREHTGRFVLVDSRGFQRIGFPLDQATPERLAHDLALLLGERTAAG